MDMQIKSAMVLNRVAWGPDEATLRQPWGTFFRCARVNGEYMLGDPESHFNGADRPEKLSYEVSNNAMLAIHGADGELKAVTCYRDTYNTLTAMWPGVWTAKDNSTYGPFSFSVEVDGQMHDLARVDWDLRTGLLDNTIPVTEYTGPHQQFVIRVITFAPVSADGAQRVRGVVHGLHLENTSSAALKAVVYLPRAVNNVPFDQWAQSDSFGRFEIWPGDASAYAGSVTVDLVPGGTAWVPAIIAPPGEWVAEDINACGTLAWLRKTQTYYRNLLGRLCIPDQPYLAEFHERMFLQALYGIALSGSGRIAGSNFGGVPPTRMNWAKDFYYMALPLMAVDPGLAGKVVEWFDAHGVRPHGITARTDREPTGKAGGVSHAISLSVAAPLLAGLLYDQSGEMSLFRRHPEWKVRWGAIFDAILASRADPEVWLFPTQYISDGLVNGDYHTGSNLAVWRALLAYARLLDEVWLDSAAAATYRALAGRVRESLISRTVIDGVYGRQFIEAVNRDGTIPAMESDGEESETTLMPYYGFLANDDPVYLNTMRFAVSPYNMAYRPELRSISWSTGVPSSAPGYNKGLCAASDAEGLFGKDGAYTELRRLADGDGALWWWSYGYGSKSGTYGKPLRAIDDIGKSGWAAGVHSVIFGSRFAGIRYDAPTSCLWFVPLPALGGLTWIDFPMGNRRFSAGCVYGPDVVSAWAENPNTHAVSLNVTLVAPGPEVEVLINGQSQGAAAVIRHYGRDAVAIMTAIPAGGKVSVDVRQVQSDSASI